MSHPALSSTTPVRAICLGCLTGYRFPREMATGLAPCRACASAVRYLAEPVEADRFAGLTPDDRQDLRTRGKERQRQ